MIQTRNKNLKDKEESDRINFNHKRFTTRQSIQKSHINVYNSNNNVFKDLKSE